MIVAAVIVTDNKLYSLLDCLKALEAVPEIDRLYLNIYTQHIERYMEVFTYLQSSRLIYDYDEWFLTGSTWLPKRSYDQDNDARLPSITIARNMAVDFASKEEIDHLLFVDSDVIIRPDGVKRILRMNKPLSGGNVPGRGAHSHVRYVFGIQEQIGNILRCAHGTMGYCLIHKSIFQYLRFRRGPHPDRPETILSEDPCFEIDAEKLGLCDGWWIDYTVIAEHRDDPDHPLVLEEAINDYGVPK